MIFAISAIQLAGFLLGSWLSGVNMDGDWHIRLLFAMIVCCYGPIMATAIAGLGWAPSLTLIDRVLHGTAILLAWLVAWLGLALAAVAEADTGLPIPQLFTVSLLGIAVLLVVHAARRLERIVPL